MTATSGGSAWATIDLGALRANYAEARRLAGGCELIAVVKADAYGHGVLPVARTLLDAGCRRLAVVTVSEAAELRAGGVGAADAEILVIGGISDDAEALEVAALGATPSVHRGDSLAPLVRAAARAAAPLPVHVEVDTGMHRFGVPEADALALLEAIAREPALALAGVYSHYACADEPDLAPSLDQARRLRVVLEEARKAGAEPELVHIANSAGLLAGAPLREALPEANAVRPGLLLYGVRPAPHLEAELRPVMTLRARVEQLRPVRAGHAVGYGATWRAERDTRIATLGIGYEDGVPVAASNRGSVRIGEQRLPIVGRVSMDSITVDVGDAPVAIGDEGVVFGAGLPVEEAASAAGTIAYELLVRVGRRVRRVYEVRDAV